MKEKRHNHTSCFREKNYEKKSCNLSGSHYSEATYFMHVISCLVHLSPVKSISKMSRTSIEYHGTTSCIIISKSNHTISNISTKLKIKAPDELIHKTRIIRVRC